MQELLDKAQEISGIQYDISSYSDIVQAIHVVQEEMGITGTTAKEASGTISGSIGSVKAAWQNLKVEISKDDGDIETAFDNLSETAGAAFDNMLPRVEKALDGVGGLIVKAAPKIGKSIAKIVPKVLPSLMETSVSVISSIGTSIVDSLPTLLETGSEVVETIGGVINEKIPTVFKIGQQILSTIADDLLNVDYEKLSANLSSIVRSALGSIKDFVSGIDTYKLGEDVSDLINGLQWKDILKDVAETIGTVIKGIPDFLSGIIENIDLDNASLVFATLFTPKLATSLASTISTSPEFKKVHTTMGETMGEGASASFFTKFSAGIEAFALGWSAGTFIRNLIGPEKIDSAVESVFEDLRLKFTGKNNETIAKEIEEMDKYKSPGIAAQMVRDAYEATGHDARGRYATGGIINHTVYDRYGNMFGEAGREAILPLDTNTEWMDELAERLNGSGGEKYTFNFYYQGGNGMSDAEVEEQARRLAELSISQIRSIGGTGF